MKMKAGRLINGLILISVGVLVILVNLGVLPPDFFSQLIKLWPLILIFMGLRLIYGGKRLTAGGAIVVTAVFLLGILLAVLGAYSSQAKSLPIKKGHFAQRLSKGQALNLKLNFGGGKLIVKTTASNRFFLSSTGFPLKVRKKATKRLIDLNIGQVAPKSIGDFLNPQPNIWRVYIPKGTLTVLNLSAGATGGEFNLAEAMISRFKINIGASDISVGFGNKVKRSTVLINGGASRIRLKLPKNVGIKVHWLGGLSNLKFPSTVKKVKRNLFQSQNYSSFKKKIDFTINTGASSVQMTQ
jgi:hypothetical protein